MNIVSSKRRVKSLLTGGQMTDGSPDGVEKGKSRSMRVRPGGGVVAEWRGSC